MPDYQPFDLLCPTFVFSNKVTPETFEKLNNACPADCQWCPTFKFANFFNPVPNEPSKMLKPSKTAVDFSVEVTKLDPADSAEAFLDQRRGLKTQVANDRYTLSVAFAALDSRSTEDDTVLIYYNYPKLDDEDIIYEEEDEKDFGLLHWRVKFADAHDMVSTIDHAELVVVHPNLIQAREEYKGDNGIFDYRKAMHY